MRAKKHLGQHFLTAPFYAKRICDAVPAENNETVVEIGPGTGALTKFLVEKYPNLFCIEKDIECYTLLQEKYSPKQVTIFNHDALSFNFDQLSNPFHAVGNLPYSVGALIIKKIFFTIPSVKSCTFMVQREVAERICAQPGTKKNGFLTVFCQFFGTPKILFHVPPGAFFPKPKVDSSVFTMVFKNDSEIPIPRDKWDRFFSMVDIGYSQRRKKLIKLLANTYPENHWSQVFASLRLDEFSRAESLSVDTWQKLFNSMGL